MEVIEIQRALNNRGFNPGDIDGVWGRRTMLAVKAFQKTYGLQSDGIVGPLTLRTLLGNLGTPAATPSDTEGSPLVWYEEALRLIGTKEDESYRSNPEILQWAKKLNIDYRTDDIPWCGLFVAHCIGATLPDEELPSHPLAARSWAKFGGPSEAMRGAVLVFWRDSKASGRGHVGFYYAEDDEAFHVLGGNQSNAVNLARVAKNRLLAVRWPRTATVLSGTVVSAQSNEPLSHNEA